MNVFKYGNPDSSAVLIQLVDEHDLDMIENEIAYINENTATDFQMIAIKIPDWNKDLSPWRAPAVFGKDDFGDGAARTLEEVLKYTSDKSKTYYIGGYSLAGLFALWAVYQTDVFSGVAAASPSAWFPGFYEYMTNNDIKTDLIYLSLGDKEEKARNPVMATVGDRIRAMNTLLQTQKKSCTLEWNPGNHFKDPDIRMAKAFSYILNLTAQPKSI
ncbi:esterase [Butyrivibrio sp. JL13D10]|uniref:esterase n=1 Tax=Butyrivibrio sp. JL13D10 TaxID=3236815 RepID=UPI0038B438BC